MKMAIGLIIGWIVLQQSPLLEIRRLYVSTAITKDSLAKLTAIVNNISSIDLPILCCYKGAVKMIQAKYAVNPFSRFADFKKGRTLIEAAIARDTTCFEMRYLRLSIQMNLPTFLGYHDNIRADSSFLRAHIYDQTDKQLHQMTVELLTHKN